MNRFLLGAASCVGAAVVVDTAAVYAVQLLMNREEANSGHIVSYCGLDGKVRHGLLRASDMTLLSKNEVARARENASDVDFSEVHPDVLVPINDAGVQLMTHWQAREKPTTFIDTYRRHSVLWRALHGTDF